MNYVQQSPEILIPTRGTRLHPTPQTRQQSMSQTSQQRPVAVVLAGDPRPKFRSISGRTLKQIIF
jgi:hypothetical protein